LIEPVERWLLDGGFLAMLLALFWRLGAGWLLWGSRLHLWPLPGMIDSQVLAALALAGLLLFAGSLLPREYTPLAGLALGGSAYLLAIAILPRHGWLLAWPMGSQGPGWWIAAGALLGLGLLLRALCLLNWKRQLRGHGVEWTRQWAVGRPYAARQLAVRALRYMGEDSD
jgi:hypothetical protein